MKSSDSSPLDAPEFGAFLFAQICEEKNGMPLSVVSALARCGVDPWREAARLAGLPSRAAADALVAIIGRISEDSEPEPDTRKIAARLIQLLPKPGSDPAPKQPEPGERRKKYAQVTTWQMCLIVLLSALVIYSFAAT